MFNASGIVQNILSGSLTYSELLRDIATVQQMSSNAIGADYIVNMLAALGCRLSLDGEKLVPVPFDASVTVTTPNHMRAAGNDLPFIKSEPFVLLPNWQDLYARVEVMLPGKTESLLVIAFRETLNMQNAFANQGRRVPSQMVCFPVMSLNDGKVKLARMSFFSFVKSSAAFLHGGTCTIVGHHARKRIQACTAQLNHSHDPVKAMAEAEHALNALRADYQQPNTLTYEQGCMLRTLLDTRKRNAKAIQAGMGVVHNEPKGQSGNAA